MKRVLISFHDITPFHLPRLRQAEEFFKQWGISHITYLFIPDYHHQGNSLADVHNPEFREWALENKPFSLQWVLHGYYHREILAPLTHTEKTRQKPVFSDHLKRRFMTAGEGEFLGLSPTEIEERLQHGIQVYSDFFGTPPDTFVAPAWLYNSHLIPILKKNHFMFTENHSHIYHLTDDMTLDAPVITWATRTPLRKAISRIGCPLLERIWRTHDLIRIAMHPYDFDNPRTIESIDKVIASALKFREPILYNQLTPNNQPE